MTTATHSTRYRPPHTGPAIDRHPDTPVRPATYHLGRYQGDPYRQLAAAVLLQATRVVRTGYHADRSLAAQVDEVREALNFLAHGLSGGTVTRVNGQEVQPDVFHELAGQEALAEMDEERLAVMICRPPEKSPPSPTAVARERNQRTLDKPQVTRVSLK